VRTPLGLFALWAAAASASLAVTEANFGASGFGDSVVRAGRFVGTAYVGVVLALYLSERGRRALTFFVCGLTSIAAIWALVAWLTVRMTVVDLTGVHETGVSRAAGPFGNYFANPSGPHPTASGAGDLADHSWVGAAGANDFGFWLAIALAPVCVLGLLEWSGRRRPAALALIAAALVALGLALAVTHSREAWLAALVGIAVSLWFQRSKFNRLGRLALAGAALAIAVAFLAVPNLRSRLVETFQPGTFAFETGPRARLDSWSDGLGWGWERFPIGWGVGAIEEHPDRFGGASAENMFIQAWASMGVAGAVLLIGCFAVAIRTSAEAVRRRPSDVAAVFSLAFFVAFVVHGMLGNTLTDPTIEILLGFALAVNLQLIGERRERSP
jgi:hypothetical protein